MEPSMTRTFIFKCMTNGCTPKGQIYNIQQALFIFTSSIRLQPCQNINSLIHFFANGGGGEVINDGNHE